MEKTDIKVTICGEEMRLVCSEPEQYIRALVAYVENKANEPLRLSNSASMNMSVLARLIYAAINITDEMFKMSEELKNTKAELAKLKAEYEEFVKTFDKEKES